MTFISSMFHLLMMVHFLYMIYYDLFVLEGSEKFQEEQKIGLGHLKFITFWDELVQCLYFTIAFANDLFGSNVKSPKKQSVLQKRRDFVFTTLGFSVANFVCMTYWGLYAVDRDLICPVEMDSWYPSWLNQGVHTVPIIGVFIELVLVEHKYPKQATGVMTIISFTLCYLLWTFFIAYYWGFWVYPVLRDLSTIGRGIFLAGCCCALSGFYYLGQFLHNLAWSKEISKNKVN